MNILIPIVLVLGALLLLKARLSAPDSTKPKRSQREKLSRHSQKRIPDNSPYSAVSIEYSGEACPAVRKMEGQRFLAKEAPITPLSECNCPKCRCRYRHYSDRRSVEDRRDPIERGRQPLEFQGAGERRSLQERRRTESTISQTEFSYREILTAAAKDESRVD